MTDVLLEFRLMRIERQKDSGHHDELTLRIGIKQPAPVDLIFSSVT
jgi:hypothetical protein